MVLAKFVNPAVPFVENEGIAGEARAISPKSLTRPVRPHRICWFHDSFSRRLSWLRFSRE